MPVGNNSRVVCALIALIGAVGAAHAGFEDDYVAGVKAFNQGRVFEAQKHFRSAFDAQPNPVDKVNIDGNMQPYIPLHWLGVIASLRGDCKAAADHWNNPANRRMIARLNLLRQQEQQLLSNCKPLDATVPPPDNTPKPPPPVVPVAPEPVPAKPVPPDALVQALQNYIGGRYAAAARIDPVALTDPRAKFHAYLIRAAARFMLANTGADANALDGARADVRAARALDSRTAPDVATFPPRFITFYSQTQ